MAAAPHTARMFSGLPVGVGGWGGGENVDGEVGQPMRSLLQREVVDGERRERRRRGVVLQLSLSPEGSGKVSVELCGSPTASKCDRF